MNKYISSSYIGAIVRKYKNMDISESTLKERCEEEMKSVYSREAEQWSVVCENGYCSRQSFVDDEGFSGILGEGGCSWVLPN